MKIMATSFKRSSACTAHWVPPTLQQATTDPRLHWRLLDTHGQVWVSLLWGHCPFSWVLVCSVLFVPSNSLFSQSCVNSGGPIVGLTATFSKRVYAIPRSAASRAPAPVAGHCWHTPLQETVKHSKATSGSVSVGSPGAHKVLFEPSERLWQVWGLILNAISPLLLSFWGFSFALGRGVSIFGGIQHSPIDSCSAMSCNFGVLIEEDECMSFYYTILDIRGSSAHNYSSFNWGGER